MKKHLLFIFLLVLNFALKAQQPLTQNLGSDSTLIRLGPTYNGIIKGGVVIGAFADTTTANATHIDYYTGALIWSTSDSSLYARHKSSTNSYWFKVGGSGGGATGQFYNLTGNYLPITPANLGVGFNDPYNVLNFRTNNTTRLTIPIGGIVRSSAAINKYLMMDTSTKEMYYGDGGGGVGTVTSVGLTMPSAFTVTNSPVTGSGTLAVTGAGTTSQYIRGDGSLATYSAGGSTITVTGQAWVDSATGDNSTARPNRPDLPFATINRALDSLASYNSIIINIGLGTYDSITESKIRSNMWLKGSKQPTTNSLDTSTSLVNLVITRPTKLIDGTIIQGGFQIRNKYNIQITDLGVDNGADRVAAGHRKYDCIDIRDAGTATAATPPFRLMDNIRIENVTCLGDTSNSAFHALTLENCIDPIVKNVLLIGNTHGLAVKTVGGIYDGITSYWHTSDGIIFKINNYAPSHEMILNNFNIRSLSESAKESGGLVFQNETGVDVRTGWVISNGAIRFTSAGIVDYANGEYYNVNVSNINIHKTTNSGIYLTGFAKGNINNCIIDSTGGNGIWITTTTGGNVFSNNQVLNQTTYGGMVIAGGTDKAYLFNNVVVGNAGNGIDASDANVYGEDNISTGNGTNYVGTVNGVLKPYLASSAKSVVGASTAGLMYPLYIGSGLSISSGGGVDTLKSSGGAGGSTVVSDSAWMLTGNTVSTGIKYNGTINSRSVNFITNNTIRMKMDSVGNFDFNPGAAAGYTYNFAAYTDPDFVKIGYGNVAYSGVTIGANAAYGDVPRLLIQGFSNDEPLLELGNGSTVYAAFHRYTSNGMGLRTTNTGNVPFTFTGGYAFKSNTYFGDSVATTNTTAKVHIAAGATGAGTAPLKFTTGTNNTTAEAGAMEYTTPQLFFTNGDAIRQEIPQIQQTMVVAQFDKTSNTTLGNVTNLAATVAAGKTYRFEAKLYTSSGSSGGVKVAIGGTASATTITYEGLTTNAGLITQSRTTTMGNAVGAVTAVTAAYILITGSITTDAGGTLTVQFAQNASDATTSSVLWGSTFVVTQMNY